MSPQENSPQNSQQNPEKKSPFSRSKEYKLTIHKVPWPVVDEGFENITEDQHGLKRDHQGYSAAFEALYMHQGVSELFQAAETTPNYSTYDLFRSPFRPEFSRKVNDHRSQWFAQNEQLIRRLEPSNPHSSFPWPVLWTIRAIEAGKAHELQPVHLRAFTDSLVTLAEHLNPTPGFVGSYDVETKIADDGHVTLTIQDYDAKERPMAQRWIGSEQKNIRAMAKAYGFPITIQQESIKCTCYPNQEGVIKVYKPAEGGKQFGFGFIKRKNGADVYVRSDQLKKFLERYGEAGIVGKRIKFSELAGDDRSRAVDVIDVEHEEMIARQKHDEKEQTAREKAENEAYFAEHLPAAIAEVEENFPFRHQETKSNFSGWMQEISGILVHLTDDERNAVYFDPEKGAQVFIRQHIEFSRGKGNSRVSRKQEFTGTVSGWEYLQVATAYKNDDAPAGTLTVSFKVIDPFNRVRQTNKVQSVQMKAAYPAVAEAPFIESGAVYQFLTATTPAGEVREKVMLYSHQFFYNSGSEPRRAEGGYDASEMVRLVEVAGIRSSLEHLRLQDLPAQETHLTGVELMPCIYEFDNWVGESEDGMRGPHSWTETGESVAVSLAFDTNFFKGSKLSASLAQEETELSTGKLLQRFKGLQRRREELQNLLDRVAKFCTQKDVTNYQEKIAQIETEITYLDNLESNLQQGLREHIRVENDVVIIAPDTKLSQDISMGTTILSSETLSQMGDVVKALRLPVERGGRVRHRNFFAGAFRVIHQADAERLGVEYVPISQEIEVLWPTFEELSAQLNLDSLFDEVVQLRAEKEKLLDKLEVRDSSIKKKYSQNDFTDGMLLNAAEKYLTSKLRKKSDQRDHEKALLKLHAEWTKQIAELNGELQGTEVKESLGWQFNYSITPTRNTGSTTYYEDLILVDGEVQKSDETETGGRRSSDRRIYHEVAPETVAVNFSLHAPGSSSLSKDPSTSFSLNINLRSEGVTPEQQEGIKREIRRFIGQDSDNQYQQTRASLVLRDLGVESTDALLAYVDQMFSDLPEGATRIEFSLGKRKSEDTPNFDVVYLAGYERVSPATLMKNRLRGQFTGERGAAAGQEVLPPVHIRADEYQRLLQEDFGVLQQLILNEKSKDIGRWRLAVAAAAVRGFEGMEILGQAATTADDFTGISKTLQKMITEARTHRRSNVDEVEKHVTEAMSAIELFTLLKLVMEKPVVSQLFGGDEAARNDFARHFYNRLKREQQTWGVLPGQDLVEKLIEDVLDDMTNQ